mgnify:CR=1 FL=1
MESFNGIVDGLFKPARKLLSYRDVSPDRVRRERDKSLNQISAKWIHSKYVYSQYIVKPYYGYDIGEPVSKICKRILEKPKRFISVKEFKGVVVNVPHSSHTGKRGVEYREEVITPQLLVLQDKDMQVKFVVDGSIIKNSSYLTEDENKLLVACIEEWYNHNREQLAEKEKRNEQKRKDKFRQEMIEQYKDL